MTTTLDGGESVLVNQVKHLGAMLVSPVCGERNQTPISRDMSSVGVSSLWLAFGFDDRDSAIVRVDGGPESDLMAKN